MKRCLALLSMALMIGLSSEAFAQEAETTQSRVGLIHYADCVFKKKPENALWFVTIGFGKSYEFDSKVRPLNAESKEYHDRLGTLLVPYCATKSGLLKLTMTPGLLAYGLADILVRVSALSVPGDRFEQARRLAHNMLPDTQPVPTGNKEADANAVRRYQIDVAENFVSKFGECFVRREAALAFSLLKTAIGSEEERLAIAALTPAMAACLPPSETVTLNKSMVRGAAALNFVRLYDADPTVGPIKLRKH